MILIFILLLLAVNALYIGAIVEARRDANRAESAALKSRKEAQRYRQRLDDAERLLDSSGKREARMLVTCRELRQERDALAAKLSEMERKLKEESVVIDKFKMKLSDFAKENRKSAAPSERNS